MDLKEVLPSKIYEVIERAGICTPKEIMTLSIWDIKKLTNLRTDDIVLMKDLISENFAPQCVPFSSLSAPKRVSAGCYELNKLLRGGYRVGSITEVYGESGCGKTQLTLQAAAHNWSTGAVFICTEDLFPTKRFEQVKQSITDLKLDCDYGKNIFVEHITEASDLLSCIRVRLPKLLQNNKVSLLVIDSIAGPFRSEYTNYMHRAEELRELAINLIEIAQKFNLAVLCTNQVTAAFDGTDNVLPTLGLAWSNMINYRLWLSKTKETINIRNVPEKYSENNFKNSSIEQNIVIRKISVIFAPDLPNSSLKIIITPTGIQSV